MDINLEKIVRVGIVSSTNPQEMTVRVTYTDEDGLVSADLNVLNRGSRQNKDYWMPDVDEQVVCLFVPNGRNAGYCLGSHFSNVDLPPEGAGQRKRILEHDGDLEIRCTGDIRINGKMIYLN